MIKLIQLILIIPIFSAIICSGLSYFNQKVSKNLNIFFAFITLCISTFLIIEITHSDNLSFVFAGFLEPFGIKFLFSKENAFLVLLINLIGFLFSLFLFDFLTHNKHQAPYFYALSNLFLVANVGLVLSQDLFNIYVFIELGGICSYALLAFKGSSASFSALRYLLAGSVAATFFLLGIALFYALSGSLTLESNLSLIETNLSNFLVLSASLFCFTALLLKAGVFPLHFWLPVAYGATHPLVAILVASIATKIAIYLLVSCFGGVINVLLASKFIAFSIEAILSFTIIYALTRAYFEKGISYIVAYIIVAEIAYIMGGIVIGNPDSIFASSYHLIADSLITAFAFSLIYLISGKGRDVYVSDLKGVLSNSLIQFIFWVYLAACFIGLPLTPSFITKIYLIKGALISKHYLFLISLLVGSLIITALFFRILFYATKETTIRREATYSNYATRLGIYCLFVLIIIYSFIPSLIPLNIFIK